MPSGGRSSWRSCTGTRSNGKYPDFDSLGRGRLVYTAEAGWEKKGSGELRLNYANAQSKTGFEGGESWSLSASYEVGRSLAVWARAAHAPRPSQDFRRQVAGGLVIKSPFGFASDQIFLAAAWTRPKDYSLRDETLLEANWRFQLTARLRVTPSLQLCLDPAGDPTRSTAFVAGLRLFVRF